MPEHLKLDLTQLRFLTEAYLSTLPETPDDELTEIPTVIQRLLDQAQSQAGSAHFTLTIGREDAAQLAAALAPQLEEAADSGDIFALGELQGLLAQLERIEAS